MYKHILVPTDGSRLSMKAARHAIKLARATRARITALHVIPSFRELVRMDGFIPTPELCSPAAYRKSTERDSRNLLAKVEALAKAARVPCDPVSVTGDHAWKSIIGAAGRRGCDLIAMSSHGYGGIAAVVLGSETNKVLAHSKIPVLVCR